MRYNPSGHGVFIRSEYLFVLHSWQEGYMIQGTKKWTLEWLLLPSLLMTHLGFCAFCQLWALQSELCRVLNPQSTSLPGDTTRIPLNYKLKLLSGHFGVLVPSEKQPREKKKTLSWQKQLTLNSVRFFGLFVLFCFFNIWSLLFFVLVVVVQGCFYTKGIGKSICSTQRIYFGTSWYSFTPLYLSMDVCRTEKKHIGIPSIGIHQ